MSNKKNIIIVDYGSGNLHSLAKSIEKCSTSDKNIKISRELKDIENASHVVLPGVGAFSDCIKNLREVTGMIDALEEFALIDKKPFLGICVGMQMLSDESHEHELTKGLGWIKGKVIPIPKIDDSIKIPHIGWNELEIQKHHPIFKNIQNKSHAYFVHSYKFMCENPTDIIAEVEYGVNITSAVAKDNLVGLQFHPEKSQENGLRILENFINM